MRETLFILGILAVLLALTAIRYRKQIAGMVGFARAIKDVRSRAEVTGERSAGTLVRCVECGVMVPESKATSLGGGRYCCVGKCVKVAAG